MKLLLVSPFTSASGSAIRFWNIAQQFKELGFDVVYIDRNPRGKKPLHRIDGIKYSPSPVLKPFIIDILVSTIYNLFMLVRHLDCSIFYALKPAPNNCFAALIAKLLGKKVVLDIDDLDYEYINSGLKRSVSRFFFMFFPQFFPLITCHTPNLVAYCKNTLHLPEHRLYYLAQGVSQEFLRLSVSVRPPAPQKSIMYVATLGITSDFGDILPMLAQVCAIHKDAAISVVGEGIRRSTFEKAASRLNISAQMSFLGRIPHADLPDIMARHSIGINYMRPTFVNNCRAILKIREYLACGLQVVCNNTGDAGLFGRHAFVEPDLAGMEIRLIELLGKRPTVNLEGRNFIKTNYSWKNIMKDFVAQLVNKGILPDKTII
jgi:glycosyltransferase involved in cell wall biosynthesis